MTAQQPYEVVDRVGEAEIRDYPVHAVAEVTVPGDFDSAGNRGFRPLFGYIQGGRIAMTAPVIQTPGPQGNTVAFVMPADRATADLPAPGDPAVGLRVVPRQAAAALRFSGRGDARDLERQGERLLAALADSPWRPAGAVRLARFNAPFIPPFLRHNEVLVDVEPVDVEPAGGQSTGS